MGGFPGDRWGGIMLALLCVAFALQVAGSYARWRGMREARGRVDAWAEGENLRVVRAWPIAPVIGTGLVKNLRDGRRGFLGSLVFRIHAVGPDGRSREGYLRLPVRPDDATSPPIAAWKATGPSFTP